VEAGAAAGLKGSLGFPGGVALLCRLPAREDPRRKAGRPARLPLEVNNNGGRQHIIAPVSG